MKPAKETKFKARSINRLINWAIGINQLFNQVQPEEEASDIAFPHSIGN
jgi:hypothetical protein